MRKKIITIITYITIITFVGFLIVVSIDQLKSIRKISEKPNTNMIINYDHIYDEDDEEEEKLEESKIYSKEKSYVLPNADKNQVLKVLPL